MVKPQLVKCRWFISFENEQKDKKLSIIFIRNLLTEYLQLLELINEIIRMSQDRRGTFDNFLKRSYLKSPMNVQEFCKNRIDEILMLTEALKESPYRGQAFQRLPKHMRRRQMSHHIKRLPRRLRNSSLISMQIDGSGLPKRPSRKYRRRPANLLLEYYRRQRSSIWLETHIWHARRFHMTTKWGYTLPEKPTNKSFRACYRAITSHCCLTDLSYYGIVELQAQENVLLEGLQQCVSTKCGLTFAAKMFKSGSREGLVTLFHPNSFPYAVIGEVSFLWKPVEIENEIRTLWIFIHPSLYGEVIDVFKILFALNEVQNPVEPRISEVFLTTSSSDSEKKESIQKSKGRNNFLDEIPGFVNKNGSIFMKVLRNKLNRFRLAGPLSMAVISDAFDVVNLNTLALAKSSSDKSDKRNVNTNALKRNYLEISDNKSEENSKRLKIDETNANEKCETVILPSWWNKFYKNEFRKKCLENQANFYSGLTKFHSPSDLPPGMVFSIVVTDPRLTMPLKRIKCIPNSQDRTWLSSVDPSLCYSALWEADLIDEVTNNKTPTALINKARSKLIVPGSDVKQLIKDDKQEKIPLLVIQRTSLDTVNLADRLDFASGFDIIVPLGWAMPVWLSLIFRGARSGGLRETKSMTLETKNLNECIQPDSRAGECENLERYNKLKSNYFKRPPSKRQNFAKIGVVSPFYFPWKALVNDWSQTKDSQIENELKFYVLRDLEKLSQLSDFLGSAMSKKCKSKFTMECVDSFRLDDMNCLVPVLLQSCGKGAPTENAMLCLPTPSDVKGFKNENICPVENSHTDLNVKARKMLKLEHAKLLKSMKRKRKLYKMKRAELQHFQHSEKKEKNAVAEGKNQKKIPISKDIVDKYNKDMEKLWLKDPQSIDSIKNSCSRTILGYVVLGGFSFSQAHGTGLGYITLHGLLHLLKTSLKESIPPLILFRNNNCVKYRFVSIQIYMNKKF